MSDDRWRELEAHLRHQAANRHATTMPLPAPSSTWSPALAGASEVVGLVRRLADRAGRDDLVAQLDEIRLQLRVRPVPVLIVGGAGQGKSSLANVLIGAGVCPTGPDRSTTVAVAVSHARDYTGELVFDGSRSGEPQPTRRPAPFPEAADLASSPVNPGNDWALRLVELGVPSPTLERGLVLIDTPPITDVWTPAGTRLLRAASGASAVVLVTSAANELTPGELDLLRAAAALCHRIVVAVNGTNAFPAWPSVIERNQLLLEQRGIPALVIALAAVPYWGDAGGLPPGPDPGVRALAAHLEESVLLDTEHQRISRALVDTFWAADRLRLRLYAERALIGDEGQIDSAAERLRRAARDAAALCVPSAEWHQLLTHGLRDLQRDVIGDLDHELARLALEVERAVATEPAGDAEWHAVHIDLHGRLADAIVHVHRVRKLALRELCKRVGDRFRVEWTRIVTDLDVASEANSLLNPRLDRPALTGPGSLADIALPLTAAHPSSPASAAAWLGVIADFLRQDTADTLDRVAQDLEHRCQQRAVELHRSIIEVSTTLTMVRHLDPETVLQRHEALENDLEQLQSIDLHLAGGAATRPDPSGSSGLA